jgi:hypothetical protein
MAQGQALLIVVWGIKRIFILSNSVRLSVDSQIVDVTAFTAVIHVNTMIAALLACVIIHDENVDCRSFFRPIVVGLNGLWTLHLLVVVTLLVGGAWPMRQRLQLPVVHHACTGHSLISIQVVLLYQFRIHILLVQLRVPLGTCVRHLQ